MADEVTREDVERVAEKLNNFAAELPPSERIALGWLLAEVERDPDEVSGYLGAISGGPEIAGGQFSPKLSPWAGGDAPTAVPIYMK
jgi:hypothetical protein